MAIVKNTKETHFANVDLDIYAAFSLESLVAAMGHKVIVLFLGRVKRTYEAHLELYRMTQTPDATIRGFCALIRALPKAQRKLWDAAKIREFSIGIRAGLEPFTFETALSEATVKEASDLNARISVTIYAPEAKT